MIGRVYSKHSIYKYKHYIIIKGGSNGNKK